MTKDMAERGKELAYRRQHHRIRTISELARRTGIDRKTLTRAEKGLASKATMDTLDEWFDALDEHAGLSSRPTVPGTGPDAVEFEVTTPGKDWRVVVRGPASIADELRHQVSELLREVDQPD